MSPEQELALTGMGDCFSHYHSEDRKPTIDMLHGLQYLARQREVTTATYAVLPDDDFLQVSVASTLTLPEARNGQEITITRTGVGSVTVNRSGTDTISGATSYTLAAQWNSITIKAYSGGWLIIAKVT